MTRPRGQSPRGERLMASVPHGHWKPPTLLVDLHTIGLTAQLVVGRAINGEIFLGWVRHQMVPTTQPGDLVIMDKLGVTTSRVFVRRSWQLV